MDRTEQYRIIEEFFPEALLNPEEEFLPDSRYDLYGILGFCGCGQPEDAAEWLGGLLRLLDWQTEDWKERALKDYWAEVAKGDYPTISYLILYWIEDRGWSEHGSSVLGSSLTPKGRAAIVACDLLIECLKKV